MLFFCNLICVYLSEINAKNILYTYLSHFIFETVIDTILGFSDIKK
jgi:hypothetical protein